MPAPNKWNFLKGKKTVVRLIREYLKSVGPKHEENVLSYLRQHGYLKSTLRGKICLLGFYVSDEGMVSIRSSRARRTS